MKDLKKIISSAAIFVWMFVAASSASAQATLSEITVKTSVVCDMCKENIEKYLAYEKGVKRSVVDLEKKTVTVSYDAGKTNPEKIRKAITKSGYDADDLPANPRAYKKLDDCCKKDAVCNDKK